MLAGIEFILNRNMRHHWMAFLLLSFSKRNVCFCKWIHFLLILYLSKERKGKKNTVIVNSSLCYYAALNWDRFWKSSDRRPLSSGTKRVFYLKSRGKLFSTELTFACRNPLLRTSYYHTSAMAKSKFEYVRLFETEDRCLPNTCWWNIFLSLHHIPEECNSFQVSKYRDCCTGWWQGVPQIFCRTWIWKTQWFEGSESHDSSSHSSYGRIQRHLYSLWSEWWVQLYIQV